jgi:phospholipid/cholesterol/gamma-HCH transport system permease protein
MLFQLLDTPPVRLVEALGVRSLRFAVGFGSLVLLLWNMIRRMPRLMRRPGLLLEQMDRIGVGSVPLVLFTSLFTGAVSAAQAGYQIRGYAPLSLVGSAVGKAVIVELAPVLTALVVAGRVSTSIAAELGTMRVTEQIDALETMAIDPIWFLAAPRFFAGIIMMPLLVIFSTVVAITGGYLVASLMYDLTAATYFQGVREFFLPWDVVINQTKAFFFGAVVTLSGVYFGYRTVGGAVGVGHATIRAIVTASVLILVINYLIATAML